MRTIEAEYVVASFWEPKLIEDWPRDKDGLCRDIDTAHEWWIKWDTLCVRWDKDQDVVEYPPESPDDFDIDMKRPAKIYVGSVEVK
jgi:hypothetical protein